MSSAEFNCETGLNYFNCGNDDEGCCTVNPCNLGLGCPDAANVKCNDGLGETPCGALCCPNATSCMWLGYTCGLLKNNTVVTVFPDQPTFITTATTSTSKSTSRTTRLTTTTSTPTSSTTILTTTTTTGVSADANPLTVPLPSAFLSALSVASALSIAAESILLPKPAASSSADATAPSPLVSPSISSSSSTSHAATIGGSVGGVAGVVLAALLIRLLWRKRKSPDRVKGTHDGESGMQGKDVDGTGSPFKAENGTHGNAVKTTRFSLISLLSPMRNRHAKNSSVDSSAPPYAELEHPNGNVSNPELPAKPPSPVELSPDGEKSAPIPPRRLSVSNWTDITSNAGTAPEVVDGPVVSPMTPNLDVPLDDKRGRRGEWDNPHVMSWMDYNRGQPSPAR